MRGAIAALLMATLWAVSWAGEQPAPNTAAAPVLNDGGLITLGLLLIGGGLFALRRAKR